MAEELKACPKCGAQQCWMTGCPLARPTPTQEMREAVARIIKWHEARAHEEACSLQFASSGREATHRQFIETLNALLPHPDQGGE